MQHTQMIGSSYAGGIAREQDDGVMRPCEGLEGGCSAGREALDQGLSEALGAATEGWCRKEQPCMATLGCQQKPSCLQRAETGMLRCCMLADGSEWNGRDCRRAWCECEGGGDWQLR